jgi:hypothetical protein
VRIWEEAQSGVCTGIVAESKHYCADGRRKHCEFVYGNYVYFHIGLVRDVKEQSPCQELVLDEKMLYVATNLGLNPTVQCVNLGYLEDENRKISKTLP